MGAVIHVLSQQWAGTLPWCRVLYRWVQGEGASSEVVANIQKSQPAWDDLDMWCYRSWGWFDEDLWAFVKKKRWCEPFLDHFGCYLQCWTWDRWLTAGLPAWESFFTPLLLVGYSVAALVTLQRKQKIIVICQSTTQSWTTAQVSQSLF